MKHPTQSKNIQAWKPWEQRKRPREFRASVCRCSLIISKKQKETIETLINDFGFYTTLSEFFRTAIHTQIERDLVLIVNLDQLKILKRLK